MFILTFSVIGLSVFFYIRGMKYLIGIMLISLFTSCGGESKNGDKMLKLKSDKEIEEFFEMMDKSHDSLMQEDAKKQKKFMEEMDKENEKWMQEHGYSGFSNEKSNDWRNQSLKEREKEREKRKKEHEKWMKERGYTVF